MLKTKSYFKLAGHLIKENGSVFIIAEAGVNHNGQLDLALKLVDVAAQAGADAVKFQTFKAEQVVTETGKMASYQQKNLGVKQSQRQMLRQLELKEKFYQPIIKRCRQKKIIFMSTPHGGKKSVDFLESLNVPAYKVGSGDLTNYLLLKRIALTRKPILMSSGMADLTEVKEAVSFLKDQGAKKIVPLHCTTNYPCPSKEVNLAAMTTMMDELDVPVGFSDHTDNHQAAIMAAALGVAVYECHFTLDKNLPGPDHPASANPEELNQRIMLIKQASVIMGQSTKQPTKSERASMRRLVRRSLVASKDLAAGHKITLADLEAKRPGDGISPKCYRDFIGRKLGHDIKQDQQLNYRDLES